MRTSRALAVVDPLAKLRVELAELRARVAALEGHDPDEDDAALLAAVVEHLGRPFHAGELLALRDMDEGVALLLHDLGIADPAAAGCWLRRVRDRAVGGLRLVRGRRGPAGYVWRVVEAEPL